MSSSPLSAANQNTKQSAARKQDLLDDNIEEVTKHQIIKFLHNLVETTPQKSSLAYQICHLIERDYLDFPELNNIFPSTRSAHKKKMVQKGVESLELKGEQVSLRKEVRRLKQLKKSADEFESAKIAEDIKDAESEIKNIDDDLEGIERDKEYREVYPPRSSKSPDQKVSAKDWSILRNWLKQEAMKPSPAGENDVFPNLDLFCEHLGFGKEENDVLRLLLCTQENVFFEAFIDGLANKKEKNTFDVVARMVGIPRQTVTDMFRPDSPLSLKGLIFPVSADENFAPGEDSCLPWLSNAVIRVLGEPDLTIDLISRRLIGEPVTTELDWDNDFSYLGERGDLLIDLLKGARASGTKGVNALLYGLQDTGKTEAVKAAAKKAGLTLYMVGEQGSDGNEPDRADRIQSALLAQALLADKPDAAILFDEMEDLLPSSGAGIFDEGPTAPTGASKVFLNRLLENNKTVTLWTANNPDKFHPAVLRRMRFSIEFKVPPASVREKFWTSISARHDFELSASDCKNFARKFIAPPGMINTAIKNAKDSGAGVKSIVTSLTASADLVFGSSSVIQVRDNVPDCYDLRLLAAKLDDNHLGFTIETLSENIKNSGHMDFSMLLYGPAGTGKSVYATYLAQELGMEPMLKRASDILDKYVGGTEEKISKIFTEAREGKKFLIIDEADTFLKNREQMEKSWEISMVNEMLTQIESHKYPMAMTTNLFKDIDPAAKRRFLFKIHCDYMSADQADMAFEVFFDRKAPESLRKMKNLTPADFALVRNQLRFMPKDMPDDKLAQLVAIEASTRVKKTDNGYAGSSIGFTAETKPKPA